MLDLITSPGVKVNGVEDSVEIYEESFHNFVSSPDNYLRYEDDVLMTDSHVKKYEIATRYRGE